MNAEPLSIRTTCSSGSENPQPSQTTIYMLTK